MIADGLTAMILPSLSQLDDAHSQRFWVRLSCGQGTPKTCVIHQLDVTLIILGMEINTQTIWQL